MRHCRRSGHVHDVALTRDWHDERSQYQEELLSTGKREAI